MCPPKTIKNYFNTIKNYFNTTESPGSNILS